MRGLLDSVMRGYSAMIYEMSWSMSVSFDRFKRSIHLDSTSPFFLTYSRMMPGGK